MKTLALALLLSCPAWGVIANVAHVACGDNGGGTCTTSAVNDTGATLLTVGCTSFTGFSCTVADSNSNTWVPLTTYGSTTLPNTTTTTIYYAVSPTVGASDTYTCSAKFTGCFQASWSGTLTTPLVIDFEVGNFTASNVLTLSPGAIVASSVGELFFTIFSSDTPVTMTGLTINSGFTVLNTVNTTAAGNAGGSAYLVTSSTALIGPTWTMTGIPSAAASSMATFHAVASAAHKPGVGTGIW